MQIDHPLYRLLQFVIDLELVSLVAVLQGVPYSMAAAILLACVAGVLASHLHKRGSTLKLGPRRPLRSWFGDERVLTHDEAFKLLGHACRK